MPSGTKVVVASMHFVSLLAGVDPRTRAPRARSFMANLLSLASTAMELRVSELDYTICARNSDLRVNLVLRPHEQRVLGFAHAALAASSNDLRRCIEQDAETVRQALLRMQLNVSLSRARMQIKHDALDSGRHLIMEVRATRCAVTGACIAGRIVRMLEPPTRGQASAA